MASIYTKIMNGELPANILYEDDVCIGLLDIRPVSFGHTLVIPRQEVDHILDLDEATYLHLMRVARHIGVRLKDSLSPQRVGMVVAGFDVPHVHIHLIPANKPGDVPIAHGSDEPQFEMAQKALHKIGTIDPLN